MTRTIRVAAVRAVLNRAPRGALGSRDVEPITRLDQQPEDGRADCERTHVEHRGHAIADEADLAGGEPGEALTAVFLKLFREYIFLTKIENQLF